MLKRPTPLAPLALLLSLGACTEKTTPLDSEPAESLAPMPPMGRLLIEEISFTGAAPNDAADHYYADQFIELINVSEDPVMLGGLLIGDLHGLAGAINSGDTPNARGADNPDAVVFSNLWRVPGAPEDHILEPGETALIAQDGVNHQPASPIDLTGARWESYVAESGGDDDSPMVDDLESVHYTAGYDWLMTVFGPSVALMEPVGDEQIEFQGRALALVSAVHLIDAVDVLMDAESADFKRLHPSLDAGFTHASGTYTGESVRRVRIDGVVQDTNDSSVDFELSTPTPGE